MKIFKFCSSKDITIRVKKISAACTINRDVVCSVYRRNHSHHHEKDKQYNKKVTQKNMVTWNLTDEETEITNNHLRR